MRYPAEHKEQTHERIVKAAARRFRSRGGEGAAIADLMRDLRLTHGGFYRHFGSKEDLFAEAFVHSLDDMGDRMVSIADHATPGTGAKALIEAYFSMEHCADVAGGCPVAALAAEIARRPPRSRGPFLKALRRQVTRMAAYLPGVSEEERIRKAMMLFSGMHGTMTIARAMADDHERRRFLDHAKAFYLEALTII
jgi:TetR/AcrR family transcriptional repressor of nem operon